MTFEPEMIPNCYSSAYCIPDKLHLGSPYFSFHLIPNFICKRKKKLLHFSFIILLLASVVSAHGPAPHGEALEIYRRDTMLAYHSLDKHCDVML